LFCSCHRWSEFRKRGYVLNGNFRRSREGETEPSEEGAKRDELGGLG